MIMEWRILDNNWLLATGMCVIFETITVGHGKKMKNRLWNAERARPLADRTDTTPACSLDSDASFRRKIGHLNQQKHSNHYSKKSTIFWTEKHFFKIQKRKENDRLDRLWVVFVVSFHSRQTYFDGWCNNGITRSSHQPRNVCRYRPKKYKKMYGRPSLSLLRAHGGRDYCDSIAFH